MSKLFQASVKENRQLTKNHHLVTLHPLERIAKPKAGQFFMLSVNHSADPLLRRPFSLHRWLGQDFQLLYKTVGKATSILKEKKTGNILEIIGPLGNSFPITGPKTKTILVAGGLGIAPIFALAETITDKKPLFFLGAKNKEEVLCINRLKSIGINPVVSTDDGTLGQKGTIVDVLKKFLTHPSPARLAKRASLPARRTAGGREAGRASLITNYCLYACGPKPMLKKLSFLTKKINLKGYIALEENMACGVGACLSCVVNTKKGFKRVCKEGPVFPIEEIVW